MNSSKEDDIWDDAADNITTLNPRQTTPIISPESGEHPSGEHRTIDMNSVEPPSVENEQPSGENERPSGENEQPSGENDSVELVQEQINRGGSPRTSLTTPIILAASGEQPSGEHEQPSGEHEQPSGENASVEPRSGVNEIINVESSPRTFLHNDSRRDLSDFGGSEEQINTGAPPRISLFTRKEILSAIISVLPSVISAVVLRHPGEGGLAKTNKGIAALLLSAILLIVFHIKVFSEMEDDYVTLLFYVATRGDQNVLYEKCFMILTGIPLVTILLIASVLKIVVHNDWVSYFMLQAVNILSCFYSMAQVFRSDKDYAYVEVINGIRVYTLLRPTLNHPPFGRMMTLERDGRYPRFRMD